MHSLFLSLLIAQPLPPLPNDELPAIPEQIAVAPKSAFPRWDNSIAAKQRPTAVFVGTPARNVRDMIVCQESDFPDVASGIIVARLYSDGSMRRHATLPANASDLDIRRAAGLEQPLANPFSFNAPYRAQASTADGSPWLPVGEQERIKAMWPEGVPLPLTLKFYKLRPASQRVAAFNIGTGDNRMFVSPAYGDANANREFPWKVSGGMDFAQAGTWRNATGMAIPDGARIQWWLGHMPVRNSFGDDQQEIAMHWQFPTGTQMFDVLIRKNDDGSEHIFNVRRRIKLASGWDDGASFLPDVAAGKAEKYVTPGNVRSRTVLGIQEIAYRVRPLDRPLDRRQRFKQANEPSVAMTDGGHFFPPGFKGTGMSCNKCHNGAVHESKEYGGPLLRGKDTVFSWHPIPEHLIEANYTPTVDNRWPLVQAR